MQWFHDIKTLITILSGYVEEIEDGIVTVEDMPKVLKQMKEEVKFLNELTIDILNFITSSQKDKARQKINLFSLIQNEIFTMLPKREDLQYLNEINRSFLIEFNKTDLKKVSLNLLNNASRHTKNGYIKVYTEESVVVFENSGEKIDEKFKDKIFEPFFTISKGKNREISGFELGLSIVKNLCLKRPLHIYFTK
ncbi:MAG: HAMP domain-containing histidine kinase [Campylobacteraceae bacterium]|nr:HAMP domain-containing histidine kinase [Campylobacteraceae bacterium]